MIGFWLLAVFCFALSYSLRPLLGGGRWLAPLRVLLLVFVVLCLLIGGLAGLR